MSEFQRQLNILDESIKRRIGDPITETEMDKYEVEMMTFEYAELKEMKQVDPETSMPYQDDSPTPE